MHRRRFLKLLGLAGLATFAALPLQPLRAAAAASVAFGGRLYRADGGRILYSINGGRSWSVHIKLGADYNVTKVWVDRSKRLRATVSYRGRTFGLVLGADLRSWMTR